MRTLDREQLTKSRDLVSEVAEALRAGGLVCLPCGGAYRVVGDVREPGVVTRLLQSKRRTRYAPSLVFVHDVEALPALVAHVPPAAARIAKAFWPGRVTILFEPNEALSPKVTKQLTRANKHIGVRVPADPVVRAVVEAFGGPLLVSSANHQSRSGAGSRAQVRKNFAARVDLFVDAGDLPAAPKSTVVRLSGDAVEIIRPGAVTKEELESATRGE